MPAGATVADLHECPGFLICMLNCSLAFYLFSYQVHEKSILLPCLPAALLLLGSTLLPRSPRRAPETLCDPPYVVDWAVS